MTPATPREELPIPIPESVPGDTAMDEPISDEPPGLIDDDMEADTTECSREVDEAMHEEHDDTEMVAIMDVLQTLGVDVEEANRFSAKVVRTAQGTNQPTFVEAYGTGRIVEHANNILRKLNIKGLAAFDLKTSKEDGTPWNFSKASDRKSAILYIRENKPSWLVGSPPCTAFSQLQGLNFKKMHPDRVKAILKEGRRHLHFVISL